MDNMFENKNTEELNSQPAAEDIKPETPAEPENTEIQPENTAQAQPDDAAPAAENSSPFERNTYASASPTTTLKTCSIT